LPDRDVDNNLGARARIVEFVFWQANAYDITIGTTMADDRVPRRWKGRMRLASRPEKFNLVYGGDNALWRLQTHAHGKTQHESPIQ